MARLAENGATAADTPFDPQALAALRTDMLRFARGRLESSAVAEDCVQEALLGALQSAQRFQRRSALRTWVFAILRNKIADALRSGARFIGLDDEREPDEAGDSAFASQLFDQRGHWFVDTRPKAWRGPGEACSDRHFWRVFETCLDAMPAQQAQVFMMREVMDLSTREIIEQTGISQSHLNVLLYRARLRLRECLDTRWFEGDGQERTPEEPLS